MERPHSEVRVMCSQCGSNARYRCPRCLLAYYCGRECQRADWLRHKPGCGTPSDAAARGSEAITHWYRTVFFAQHYTALAAEANRRNDTIIVQVMLNGPDTSLTIQPEPWQEYLYGLATHGPNVGERESATRARKVIESHSALWIVLYISTRTEDANISATQVVWVADTTLTDIHSLD